MEQLVRRLGKTGLSTIGRGRHLVFGVMKTTRGDTLVLTLCGRGIRYQLPDFAGIKERSVDRFRRRFDFRTTYAGVDSTDCDHTRVRFACAFDCYLEFAEYREQELWNAEGPTWIGEVDRAFYEGFEAERRDMALEAFEDGHAHVIYR